MMQTHPDRFTQCCCLILTAVLLTATGWAAEPVAEVDITVDASRVQHTMRGGFGASWHAIEQPLPVIGGVSHGGSAWGANPPASDNRAWREIYRHADWLGLDFVRVEIEQRMFEPERGRFTWESPEMRILYRILDWCESRGADVFLQNMWGNVEWNAFPEFRGDAIRRLHSGPYSIDDFAHSLAALVKHLTQERRYTCIRWLCINNEPGYDWSWWQRPPNEPLPIGPALAAVRAALDREGLRLQLSGPDWTDLPDLEPGKIDFDQSIGAYDLHSYCANFDWRGEGGGYPLRVAEQRLAAWRQWSAERGKPLFLSELGAMVYGWRTNDPGPSTWPASIQNAELVVRALNLGIDGFNRWSFLNRGDLDGVWQMLDTWDSKQGALLKAFRPRPNAYFTYGLISRLTTKHSDIMASDLTGGRIEATNRVFSAALRSPRREVTWIVINDAPRAWDGHFRLLGCERPGLYSTR